MQAAITDAETRLRAVATRVNAGAPLPPLRPEVIALRRRLIRLAADWSGALPKPAVSSAGTASSRQ